MNKLYVFANWGEKVWVRDYAGNFKKGVITEFDPSVPESDTKVVYKNGGFDWFSRDGVEEVSEMVERDLIDVYDSEK